MGDVYTNPPQSRNEAILRATIDGTEYTAPPQSRIEDLLLELKEAIEQGGGAGGMSKDTYDPDDAVADAGGIAAYVDDEINDLDLGTASTKNSTSVVTQSTDLVESGAVKDIIGWGNKNILPLTLEILKKVNTSGTWSGNAYTIGNVTLTISTDRGGSVTKIEVNGSAASTTNFYLCDDLSIAKSLKLKGCPSGGGESSYKLLATNTSGYSLSLPEDYGSGADLGIISSAFRIQLRLYSGAGTVSNLAFYPMLYYSTITDATYEPYHPSVVDMLRDAEVIEGKNVLRNIAKSETKQGINYTVNNDLSVTCSNTASDSSVLLVGDIDTTELIVGETYILSGCPKNGADNKYYLWLGLKANASDAWGTNIGKDFGDGYEFTVPANSYGFTVNIGINAGQATNFTYYPMICTLEEWNKSHDYEPYYIPLKDVVPTKADNSVIAPVEDGATCANPNGYAVGEYFIRNGAFCTVTSAISANESLVGSSKFTSGDVASELEVKESAVTNIISGASVVTNNMGNHLYKYGRTVELCLTISGVTCNAFENICKIPDGYMPKNGDIRLADVNGGKAYKTYQGNIQPNISLSSDLVCIHETWII